MKSPPITNPSVYFMGISCRNKALFAALSFFIIGIAFLLILQYEKGMFILQNKWQPPYDVRGADTLLNRSPVIKDQPVDLTRYNIRIDLKAPLNNKGWGNLEMRFCDKYSLILTRGRMPSGVYYYKTDNSAKEYVSKISYKEAIPSREAVSFGLQNLNLYIKCDFNFRLPYFSRNISDFWRRWHMSMTYWFRDYVFFPIIACTKGNAYLSSFVTLLCISLWHSISLNSIFRGVYFGLAVAVFHLYKKYRAFGHPVKGNKITQGVIGFLSWLVTFHIVCFGWLFFYPSSLKNTATVLTKVFTDFQFSAFIPRLLSLFAYIFVLVAVEILQAIKKDEFAILKTSFLFKAVFTGLHSGFYLASAIA